MLVVTNYACQKLCQHNLSKPSYATVCDTIRTLSHVVRRPMARTYIKGRYVNCQRLQSFQVCLNLFGAKMDGTETQVCRRGDVERSPIRAPDHIYRVIYASFTRFRIFLKRRVFCPFSSFFFFQKKKTTTKKRIKKPLTRNVGYLNRFRRLHKNGKTTEIHCMIAFLQHPLQSMRNDSSSVFMMFLYNLFKLLKGRDPGC